MVLHWIEKVYNCQIYSQYDDIHPDTYFYEVLESVAARAVNQHVRW